MGENAFDAVCDMAKSRVLELGSGTGSIELAKRFDILSIEDNVEYIEKYQGGTVAEVPLNGAWYDVLKLTEAIRYFDYDFIIVDAPSPSFLRLGFLFHYGLFKKVPFLIDDTHREYEQLMVQKFIDMGMKAKVIHETDKQAMLLWAD